MMLRATLFAVLATSASAEDHSACYTNGEAPKHVRQATPAEQTDIASLAFGYHVLPLYFSRFCGEDPIFEAAWSKSVLNEIGCSPASSVGQSQLSYVAMPFKDLSQRFAGYDVTKALGTDVVRTFCAEVAAVDLAALLSSDTDDHVSQRKFTELYGEFERMADGISEEDC
mmetsp:Transcript_9157/g.15271  ORF Transcript_9157/g.15271 Transcript_9157/m.15271 type:complete len:170 (-) Transcript_9157:409-918(-)